MEFLADANVAGQTLLRLASRGDAIIAELLRLSDHIPSILYMQDKADEKKYSEILLDFKFLNTPEFFQDRIARTPELIDLDEDFWENHYEILERFYLLFESIYKYIKDFRRYLEDLNDGVFIQHTVEIVLLDTDGKQLMCETLYLYGVMLILLDLRIEGPIRERILIAYYRHKGGPTIENVEDICTMLRSTGFSQHNLDRHGAPKRPANYPEDFFSRMIQRLEFDPEVIKMIMSRLRSEDIYLQISSYPTQEHRSTALATQARMLYVNLYFVPHILANEQASMREIVDRHFSDNWVVAYYMGFTVDLSQAWEPYKAAKAALSNTLQINDIKRLHEKHLENIEKVRRDLQHNLTEGILTEDYALDHRQQLLGCVRDCNVTIRWLLLHRTCKTKKLRELIAARPDADSLLLLIMNASQFEYQLKTMFQGLLESKQKRWEDCQKQSADMLTELSETFSGEKPLSRVAKNDNLQEWFKQLADQVKELDFSDSTLAGRKMHQLILALEEVEQFHQIDAMLQIKQFLMETRQLLSQMIRLVNIHEQMLVTLSVVSDMSYAWHIINDYTKLMHIRIQRDPFCVLKLRATFLKLVSILDLPLVRINQANSPDLLSVSEYHSGELVTYVRGVLQVIPQNMFNILQQIMQLQTHGLKELPIKMVRTELKDWSQLDQRYLLAKYTHRVSVLTEGILNMQTTLLGIIKVDPKELLQDGIRRELVLQIAQALHQALIFKTGKVEELTSNLLALRTKLDGYRLSLEYISDYVKIYGLKFWQEEFSRVVNYNVEQETNNFLKRKMYDWQSTFQSTAIPIPRYAPVDDQSINFIGRLVRELLYLCSPRRTVYLDTMSAWVDKDGREVVGIKMVSLLNDALGRWGLTGVDNVLAFMVVSQLQYFVKSYRTAFGSSEVQEFLGKFQTQLEPTASLPDNAHKLYQLVLQRLAKFWPEMLEIVSRNGTAQLLRRSIANVLRWSVKHESNLLCSVLETANSALLTDVKAHYADPENKPYPKEDNPILEDLSEYMEAAGLSDCMQQIYITTEPLSNFSCVMALFTLSQVSKLHYNKDFGTCVNNDKKSPLDGVPFVVGIITLLKQFHSSHTHQFFAYLAQFVRCQVHTAFSREPKPSELPSDAIAVLLFMEDFCKYGQFPRQMLSEMIPPYILNHFEHK